MSKVHELEESLLKERARNGELEGLLKASEERVKALEKTNFAVTSLLVEKDHLAQKYITSLNGPSPVKLGKEEYFSPVKEKNFSLIEGRKPSRVKPYIEEDVRMDEDSVQRRLGYNSKSRLNELENDLQESRAKVLKLIEEKNELESELIVLKKAKLELEERQNSFNNVQDSSQIMQQLSFIILSKENESKAKSLFTSVFGEECTKLVETYENTVKGLREEASTARNKAHLDLRRNFELLIEKQDFLNQVSSNDEGILEKINKNQKEIRDVEQRLYDSRPSNIFNYRDSLDMLRTRFFSADKMDQFSEHLRDSSSRSSVELSVDNHEAIQFIAVQAAVIEELIGK